MPILQAWGMTETQPARRRSAACKLHAARPAAEDELADVRATQGIAAAAGGRSGSSSPGTRRRAAVGRRGARRAAGAPARGSRPATTATSARADSFTDDGWLRTGDVAMIARTATSGSSTAPRTWSSPAASGSARSSSRTQIMAHPAGRRGRGDRQSPTTKWGERPLACVVAEDGRSPRPGRAARVPRRRGCAKWWIPRRRRVHRRGPEDLRRQVLQEDAARAVRGSRHVISQAELRLAARNHGMPLEALRYDVTPPGLHYLLIHYDIPAVDAGAWRLRVGGARRAAAVAVARRAARAAARVDARRDAGVRRQRPRAAGAAAGQPAVAARGGRHGRVDRRAAARRCSSEAGRAPTTRSRSSSPALDRGVEGGVEQRLRAQPPAGRRAARRASCSPTR